MNRDDILPNSDPIYLGSIVHDIAGCAHAELHAMRSPTCGAGADLPISRGVRLEFTLSSQLGTLD
jgi:hypothetical protein